MNRFVRWFVVSLSTTYLIGYDFLKTFTSPWNRYFYLWNRWDLVWLVTELVFISGTCMLVVWALHYLFPRGRYHKTVFLWSLLFCFWIDVNRVALRFLDFIVPKVFFWMRLTEAPYLLRHLFPVAVFGTLMYASIRYRQLWGTLASRVLIVLSPSVLIFLVIALGYKPYKVESGQLSPEEGLSEKNAPVVYFFLFDELDYNQSFAQGRPLSDLQGFSELAHQSMVFHRAYTPVAWTFASVPKLLARPSYSYDKFCELVRTAQSLDGYLTDNIFAEARRDGFRTAIMGGFMNYDAWFPHELNYLYSTAGLVFPNSERLFNLSGLVWSQVAPLFQRYFFETYFRIQFRFELESHLRKLNVLHSKILSVLKNPWADTLFYFHYSVPHGPYLFPPEGDRSFKNQTEASYRRNLVVADRTLRDLIAVLKSNGSWERALIIVTGDHGCKTIEHGPEKTHTVLMIKLPNQKTEVDVLQQIHVANVQDLVRTYLKNAHTKNFALTAEQAQDLVK